jgi:hypothetical protein
VPQRSKRQHFDAAARCFNKYFRHFTDLISMLLSSGETALAKLPMRRGPRGKGTLCKQAHPDHAGNIPMI